MWSDERKGYGVMHDLTAAYAAHPERFVRQPPTPPALPAAAWINAPSPTTLTLEAQQQMQRAGVSECLTRSAAPQGGQPCLMFAAPGHWRLPRSVS
jgi:hypothetical protein